MTFRAQYEQADRGGSGLDEASLVQIGEQPAMRHSDVANRTRNRLTGQVDVVPNEIWTFSATAGFGQDDFDDSYFGLQESDSTQFLARRRFPDRQRLRRRRQLQLRALLGAAALAIGQFGPGKRPDA